jgi:hypothetical protein
MGEAFGCTSGIGELVDVFGEGVPFAGALAWQVTQKISKLI